MIPDLLVDLLASDLDFHDQDSGYASHNIHAFPAKFPPQLPAKFIERLTEPGDVALDPMSGSGTTAVEAYLANRHSIAFDIDPLALLLGRVKTAPINPQKAASWLDYILQEAEKSNTGQAETNSRFNDAKTERFVNYWFDQHTQQQLAALLEAIENIPDQTLRNFFKLTLSSVIINRSGGVSLAIDLAHTRPHRAKVAHNQHGELIFGDGAVVPASRRRYQRKIVRSVWAEFEKRAGKQMAAVASLPASRFPAHISKGNAQRLPLPAESVDLIVTSPPYASNAIDYLRAHKFSLVWLGHSAETLSASRDAYLGHIAPGRANLPALPAKTTEIVRKIAQRNQQQGLSLHRYFAEMGTALGEMFRALKRGKAAILVVGSSILHGYDTETHLCLAEIGEKVGFIVPAIGVRNLDRNRRMMPASHTPNHQSQIQRRMRQEYVIGFYKPA